jgi:hypothetical protein
MSIAPCNKIACRWWILIQFPKCSFNYTLICPYFPFSSSLCMIHSEIFFFTIFNSPYPKRSRKKGGIKTNRSSHSYKYKILFYNTWLAEHYIFYFPVHIQFWRIELKLCTEKTSHKGTLTLIRFIGWMTLVSDRGSLLNLVNLFIFLKFFSRVLKPIRDLNLLHPTEILLFS